MALAEASARGSSALRVLRASQWRHFVLLPAAAFGRDALAHPLGAALLFARGALVAALALSFSYGLNAVHDRATDRSAAKNPLAGAPVVAIEAQALVWGCGALALIAAMSGGASATACTAASLLTGGVYSAGPRLKAWPLLGTVLNVGIFLPLMWVAGPVAPRSAALPLTFAAMLVQNQLWHEREDLEEDRAAGVRTTAALLGERGTAVAAAVIGAIGAAAAVAGSTRFSEAGAVLAACALGSAVPLVVSRERRRAAHRAAAMAGGALVYAAGLVSP